MGAGQSQDGVGEDIGVGIGLGLGDAAGSGVVTGSGAGCGGGSGEGAAGTRGGSALIVSGAGASICWSERRITRLPRAPVSFRGSVVCPLLLL